MHYPDTQARRVLSAALLLALGTLSNSAVANAEHGDRGGGEERGGQRGALQQVEPQRSPRDYRRVDRPPQSNVRPQTIERRDYNHNFNAERNYGIGPYHAPRGFRYQRFGYGAILPRIFWSPSYYLSDFWLFGLDVPPIGFEWVRYGPDALLIDLRTGEVVQAVYACFR